jgi:hypothetical protein
VTEFEGMIRETWREKHSEIREFVELALVPDDAGRRIRKLWRKLTILEQDSKGPYR